MSYKYNSRSAKRIARKSRRNFIISLILIAFLLFASIQWILPSVINGAGLVNSVLKPSKKVIPESFNSLAPPVLNIPFEATNTPQININGFASPGSQVKIYVDDELKDTTQTPSDGKFEFTDISLSAGRNNIFGKTANEEGSESMSSKTIIIFYDNEKPELSISEPEDGKTIQGGDKKINIKGNTEPDVKVYINDTRLISNLDGSFSSEQILNEGDNVFTIKAIDGAGNETSIVRKVIFKN